MIAKYFHVSMKIIVLFWLISLPYVIISCRSVRTCESTMVSDTLHVSKFEFAETNIDSITIVRFAYNYDTLPTTNIAKPSHRVRKKDTASVVTIYGVSQDKHSVLQEEKSASQTTKETEEYQSNSSHTFFVSFLMFILFITIVSRSRR